MIIFKGLKLLKEKLHELINIFLEYLIKVKLSM
jgi:hypothetical protein